jgi:acetylornithine deacetylase/succinyl-diaminopimelate desuccinylase-like protein
MSTILRLQKEGVKPRRTLVFAFVGDEETGLDEADGTTRQIAAHPWVKGAEYAINTDAGGGLFAPDGTPMIYLIQGAEKTYATFELTTTNPGGHSSRPRADNAIYDLSKAVTRVGEYRFPIMSNDLTRAYLGAVGKVTPGPAGEALRRFAADPKDQAAAEAISGSAEFVGTIRTTCVMTMLNAGHAENALPQKATATVNCRIFPGVSVEEVQQQLGRVVADPKVAVNVVGAPVASPVSELRPDIETVIAQSIHRRYPGVALSAFRPGLRQACSSSRTKCTRTDSTSVFRSRASMTGLSIFTISRGRSAAPSRSSAQWVEAKSERLRARALCL